MKHINRSRKPYRIHCAKRVPVMVLNNLEDASAIALPRLRARMLSAELRYPQRHAKMLSHRLRKPKQVLL